MRGYLPELSAKTFTYGSSSAAGPRTNGRLQTATRYNSVGPPFNATVAITETYAYGGRQGRTSSRTTQMIFNGTPSESFTQGWSWNALGDPGSVTYPQCAFAGCAPVSRTVSPGYTNGFLTSVAGWATAISARPPCPTHDTRSIYCLRRTGGSSAAGWEGT